LTNHGVLQIESLAQSFASKSIHFDSVYASDLSRARITAEGICRSQPPKKDGGLVSPILTSDLRERDFGSWEGVRWQSSSAPSNDTNVSPGRSARSTSAEVIKKETTVSMRQRAFSFLDSHFLPLLFDDSTSKRKVAIVAHGIILRVLWNCLVELFDPMNISLMPGITAWDGGPAALLSPSWSNAGCMELSICMKPSSASPPQRQLSSHESRVAPSSTTDTEAPLSGGAAGDILLQGWSMKILNVDNKEHLACLRRTRGGIGSASHDSRQKRIDQFFK
jgi:broad specificity phosphatase PhoE